MGNVARGPIPQDVLDILDVLAGLPPVVPAMFSPEWWKGGMGDLLIAQTRPPNRQDPNWVQTSYWSRLGWVNASVQDIQARNRQATLLPRPHWNGGVPKDVP